MHDSSCMNTINLMSYIILQEGAIRINNFKNLPEDSRVFIRCNGLGDRVHIKDTSVLYKVNYQQFRSVHSWLAIDYLIVIRIQRFHRILHPLTLKIIFIVLKLVKLVSLEHLLSKSYETMTIVVHSNSKQETHTFSLRVQLRTLMMTRKSCCWIWIRMRYIWIIIME